MNRKTQVSHVLVRAIAFLPFVLYFAGFSAWVETRPATGDRGESQTVTAVPGVLVGHAESSGRPTGCTVVLFPDGTVGGVDVRGGAPGTREVALLNPTATVDEINAIVLTGGSAYGLEVTTGVMKYLANQGKGYETPNGVVPIVPAAVIYDLDVGANPSINPTSEMGFEAAKIASSKPVNSGSIGVGAGASVGKLLGFHRAMRGGIGSAAEILPDGTIISVIVAVNAVGNVLNLRNEPIAGCLSANRKLILDASQAIRSSEYISALPSSNTTMFNTTIGIVVTNATLSKTEATKVAQMAHNGLARAITPAHTPFDGDTIFTAATGSHRQQVDLLVIGSVAADVFQRAVIDAVMHAKPTKELPVATMFRDGKLLGASHNK